MSWFTKIFSGGVAEVVTAATDGLDKVFTNDEERLVAEAILPQIRANLQVKLAEMENATETFVQGQNTERQKLDMQSDSWLSKNIRPLSLVHVTLIFDLAVFVSYFGPVPATVFTAGIIGAWELMNAFYFGGRTLEKGAKIIAAALKKGV